jgi:hypothetical protein
MANMTAGFQRTLGQETTKQPRSASTTLFSIQGCHNILLCRSAAAGRPQSCMHGGGSQLLPNCIVWGHISRRQSLPQVHRKCGAPVIQKRSSYTETTAPQIYRENKTAPVNPDSYRQSALAGIICTVLYTKHTAHLHSLAASLAHQSFIHVYKEYKTTTTPLSTDVHVCAGRHPLYSNDCVDAHLHSLAASLPAPGAASATAPPAQTPRLQQQQQWDSSSSRIDTRAPDTPRAVQYPVRGVLARVRPHGLASSSTMNEA